jgi:hypothetical protein
MNRHPLKMRALKFVKFASIYKETVEDIKETVEDIKETVEDIKETVEVKEEEEEEDFYVITDSE